ncbi:MAG: hypothetical protein WKF58_06080 [Ilumatobacteraceae bacterium]
MAPTLGGAICVIPRKGGLHCASVRERLERAGDLLRRCGTIVWIGSDEPLDEFGHRVRQRDPVLGHHRP